MRPDYQREPANMDTRVRIALYQAIDRDGLARARAGEYDGVWSILPPPHPLYSVTKDALRRYPYEPERAKAILQEQGWTPGPDGILRNSADGRRFQTQIANTAQLAWETQVYADYWRRIGVDVEEDNIPAPLQGDLEYR